LKAALKTEPRSQVTPGLGPGEPCLTRVWPGLGLAGVPGRVSSLAGWIRLVWLQV